MKSSISDEYDRKARKHKYQPKPFKNKPAAQAAGADPS